MSDRVVSRESDKFMLRLPDGMREQLKVEAEKHGRSMNAEIVARLQNTIETDELNRAMWRGERTDTAQHAKDMLHGIKNEIGAIYETLQHYKTQHIWREFYVNDDKDRLVMDAINRYLSDEVAKHNDGLDYDDMIDGISRTALITDTLADFLIERGYLSRARDGELKAEQPQRSA